MKDTVVIFYEGGARILEGMNGQDFKDVANCLVNPVFPLGIPPHRWILKNGKIEVAAESFGNYLPPAQLPISLRLGYKYYLLNAGISAVISVMIGIIFKHGL